MSQEIVKFDLNNTISLEYSSNIKEELMDEYYQDNKVCVFETIIPDSVNISNTEINDYMRNDKIRKYDEVQPVDHIKTDFQTSEVNATVSNNVKIEDEIYPIDEQFKFCSELRYCNHCHEVYQDYCTKCRVLVHILNERPGHNTYNTIRELPKYMLETRESTGHLGIFSLKVIPENIRFGPFTGLDSARGLCLKIKGGRFVVSDDKLEQTNWMQYINPARNVYEQNLFPFLHEDKVYYCSTRRIQEGEELLVYFGEEYEDSLLQNVQMDFVPITRNDVENVFACIFCCMGFSSKEYLAEHKTMCHSEMFSVEELAQCPFCKIYLDAKEYFEHHMDYCCETNDRYCVLPTPECYKSEIERCLSLRSKKRRIYKCTQCKFKTMYNADLRHHTNVHYTKKMYKCGICYRRFKAKEYLKAHMGKFHVDSEVQKYFTRDYFKANIKNIKGRSRHSHDVEQLQSPKCKFRPKSQIIHLNRDKYKCVNCEFKTYYRTYLERHMNINHLMKIKSNYKCSECEFETEYKSSLGRHKIVKHLKATHYKCMECEYKTNIKSRLKAHIKSKHLKESDYKCAECEFETSYKSSLEAHIKTKHLEQNDYKCAECEYHTNYKSYLQVHIKAKHLNENYYKCRECEFKTNYKSSLETHIKTKHLEEKRFKCMDCEYNTYYKLALEGHIKKKHLNQNDYKCAECGFETNNKSSLKEHIKAKHIKDKDYKCMECEYQTNKRGNLIIHIKTKHLKENDYKCAECEFETNYKSTFDRHIKIKHLKQKDDRYDYKCIECEYRTNKKGNLKMHVKTKHLKENDYKCTECEFETNYKSTFDRHVQIKHLKQKDYKCTECEYKASHKSSLERHVKTNHGVSIQDKSHLKKYIEVK